MSYVISSTPSVLRLCSITFPRNAPPQSETSYGTDSLFVRQGNLRGSMAHSTSRLGRRELTTMADPPSSPGTYALILAANCHQELNVGKLGTLVVQPGFYTYAGSAFGPGGLASRIARHLRNEKKHHWHIDYLLDVTPVVEVWWIEGEEHRECQWAEAFGRMRKATVPLAKFGASDCKSGCPAHLYRFPGQPRVRTFRKHLAAELGVAVENLQISVQRVEEPADRPAGAGRIRLR